MRIVFIGNVKFSLCALEQIVAIGGEVVAVCTKKNSKFNSDHVDLTAFAKKQKIDSCYVHDINDDVVYDWIVSKKPDIIFCFGWSQILKRRLINLPPLGIVGYHPTALPKNRGRHPIIWALVLGLSRTASTFFFIDENVDAGGIISQVEVDIKATDNSSTLYAKLIDVAKDQIQQFLPKLISGNIVALQQDLSLGNSWRKRGHLDGQIDWRMSAEAVHNLVRALTRPYSGAHFIFNDQEIKVWKTQISNQGNENIEPGKIIGHISGAPLVKCGLGSVCLSEIGSEIQFETGDYL